MSTSSIVNWGKVFSVRMPESWTWEEQNGIVSVYKPDGAGVLNISLVDRGNSHGGARAISRQLAASWASQRSWDVSEQRIRTFGTEANAISEFEFTEHGDQPAFWHVWHVVGESRAAFVTYTCEPADSELESKERNAIISSLRWC